MRFRIAGFGINISHINQLVVDYTQKGLYEIIYEMDERSSRPKVNKLDWKEIQQNTLKINSGQKEILLSDAIKANIKKFEEKYLDEEVPAV